MTKNINIQTQHQIIAEWAIKDWLTKVLIPIETTWKNYLFLEQCSWEIKQAMQYKTEIIYIDKRWARHQE